MLDGDFLFRVAAPLTASPNQLSIAARAATVNDALGALVAMNGTGAHAETIYDPATIRVEIEPKTDDDVLVATDAKHPQPLPIVTVTSVDAAYQGTDIDSLAKTWQGTLQSALKEALALRQPSALRRNAAAVARLAALLVVVTIGVGVAIFFLGRRTDRLLKDVAERERELESRQAAESAVGTDASEARRGFLALAIRAAEPERRLAVVRALSEALIWGVLLAWFLAVTWAFSLFPQTTPLAQDILHGAFTVATTVVALGLLNRLLDLAIAHGAKVWRVGSFLSSEDRARQLLRIPTIANTLAGFKTFLIVFVGVLTVLGELGAPIGSVVTIGGLAAIGLSLAAQNLVRDFLNGFLVLFEDQYVVGDYVTINAFSGLVERLTLRIVQLRDTSGNVVTIPHSSVTAAVNQSRNWSRVDFQIPVDPNADVEKAIAVVQATIEGLAREKAWRASVLGPLEWIGVDSLSKDWALVRASLRTAPLHQFEVRRELLARVRTALAQAGIPLGLEPPPGS